MNLCLSHNQVAETMIVAKIGLEPTRKTESVVYLGANYGKRKRSKMADGSLGVDLTRRIPDGL